MLLFFIVVEKLRFFLYNSALKFYPLHSIGITLEDQETQHIFQKILNKTCFHLILSLSASTLLISLIKSFKTCSLKYNPSVDEKNNNNMIESRILTNIYFVTFSQLHFPFMQMKKESENKKDVLYLSISSLVCPYNSTKSSQGSIHVYQGRGNFNKGRGNFNKWGGGGYSTIFFHYLKLNKIFRIITLSFCLFLITNIYIFVSRSMGYHLPTHAFL